MRKKDHLNRNLLTNWCPDAIGCERHEPQVNSAPADVGRDRAKLHPIRWEFAGAFGDIGILFPIAIALVSLCHVNPTAIFLTAGLSYILAGAYFRIPIPVQPFKAVAAIALALHLAPSSIASAGVLMGVLLAVVGLTNLVTPLAKLFSLPIVRGIQLGLGLILVREGIRLSLGLKWGLVLAGVAVPSWMLAAGGAGILLICQRSRRLPAALALLGTAIVLGLVAYWHQIDSLQWGPVPLEILHPHLAEFRTVLTLLVLPQCALTFGNSIVATENTARLLYDGTARPRVGQGAQHKHRADEPPWRIDLKRAMLSRFGWRYGSL
jgi:SulP family sulfate permease